MLHIAAGAIGSSPSARSRRNAPRVRLSAAKSLSQRSGEHFLRSFENAASALDEAATRKRLTVRVDANYVGFKRLTDLAI